MLRAAIAGSSYVVAARRGKRLVGLARAVSDDATICYLPLRAFVRFDG